MATELPDNTLVLGPAREQAQHDDIGVLIRRQAHLDPGSARRDGDLAFLVGIADQEATRRAVDQALELHHILSRGAAEADVDVDMSPGKVEVLGPARSNEPVLLMQHRHSKHGRTSRSEARAQTLGDDELSLSVMDQ